ncbi:hypothetical protein BJX68DRAFT_236676 [Aspergillus pseudodeflectus]|uniref:Uncharacterized protein n=1 Tax=Aspergillus pseudodeflectus TaxID=176178 RepID=A0ABR4KF85_9EURO
MKVPLATTCYIPDCEELGRELLVKIAEVLFAVNAACLLNCTAIVGVWVAPASSQLLSSGIGMAKCAP